MAKYSVRRHGAAWGWSSAAASGAKQASEYKEALEAFGKEKFQGRVLRTTGSRQEAPKPMNVILGTFGARSAWFLA